MRLLNVRTLALEQFNDGKLPPYAILSHTWRQEEVTFEQMGSAEVEQKPSFQKIRDCSDTAKSNGYSHIWIDTICI
jgi:hypothetical protein